MNSPNKTKLENTTTAIDSLAREFLTNYYDNDDSNNFFCSLRVAKGGEKARKEFIQPPTWAVALSAKISYILIAIRSILGRARFLLCLGTSTFRRVSPSAGHNGYYAINVMKLGGGKGSGAGPGWPLRCSRYEERDKIENRGIQLLDRTTIFAYVPRLIEKFERSMT